MNNVGFSTNKTRYIVMLAILTAFVLLFQIFGSYIKIGATNFSFVLVPICLGGILLGPLAGLFLGFVFSLTVMIMGFTGADSFTNILLVNAPFGTLLCIFLKGMLAGFIPALVYKLIAKKNKTIGVFVSSFLTPIINTGVFIICMLFLSNVLKDNFDLNGASVVYFLVILCAGINFLIELAINIVFTPAINRVIKAISK